MKGNPLMRGLLTGMALQLALGPVFIFVANTAFQSGMAAGLSAAAGATATDFIFITLAMAGLGRLLERERARRFLSAAGSPVLVVFGIMTLRKGLEMKAAMDVVVTGGAIESFVASFMLTASSPLSILFWSGIFTARMSEFDSDRRGLLLFGFAAGSATMLFLGAFALFFSAVRIMLPSWLFSFMNILVGLGLVIFGVMVFLKSRRERIGAAK
jgi:threonine/homoserine/homoserine lactone efflux protein